MPILKRIPIYPLLFAAFPTFSMASANATHLEFSTFLRPLLWSLTLALMLFAGAWLIKHEQHRAALFSASMLLLFFTYGHARHALGTSINPTAWLLPAWLALMLLALWWTMIRPLNAQPMTAALNTVSLMLMLVPVLTLGVGQMTAATAPTPVSCELPDPPALNVSSIPPAEVLPDIYYIILDGYGRADTLSRVYAIDNQAFLDFLTEHGFHVAENSVANYNQTLLSLPASLNMNYIQHLQCVESKGAFDYWNQVELIQHGQVFKFAAAAGYQLVAFSSGHSLTEITNADHYMAPPVEESQGQTNSIEILGASLQLSGSEFTFLDSTLLQPILPVLLNQGTEDPRYQARRERIDYTFTHLADFAQNDQPQLIFAHIIAPHPPFVFHANGQPREHWRPFSIVDGSHWIGSLGTRSDYISGYRDQLLYVNQQLTQALEQILAQSEISPVIILQSDHGPGAYFDWQSLDNTDAGERMGILNAYHLPNADDKNLYPSITPVNSFRVVFNQVLGQDLPLLQDRAYYSEWSKPFHFTEVTQGLLTNTSSPE